MRNKTIREAFAGALLITFIFAAAPATARGAGPSPRSVRESGSVLAVLADWFSAWTGVAFERAERPAGVRGETKAVSSYVEPEASSVEGCPDPERCAAIDPLGLR